MRKILTLGYVPYGTGRVAPFDAIFGASLLATPQNIREGSVSALVIWGGEDISPTLYNEPVGPHTYAGATLSKRDLIEQAVCQAAIEAEVPIIGICRGAQLLCAMAGGKLVQHVSHHMGDHTIVTDDGTTYITSSVHHQMMMPMDTEHTVIAVDGRKNSIGDPEIVYFPQIKGLAIQGHPEFMNADDPFVLYCLDLVRSYLLEEVTC